MRKLRKWFKSSLLKRGAIFVIDWSHLIFLAFLYGFGLYHCFKTGIAPKYGIYPPNSFYSPVFELVGFFILCLFVMNIPLSLSEIAIRSLSRRMSYFEGFRAITVFLVAWFVFSDPFSYLAWFID